MSKNIEKPAKKSAEYSSLYNFHAKAIFPTLAANAAFSLLTTPSEKNSLLATAGRYYILSYLGLAQHATYSALDMLANTVQQSTKVNDKLKPVLSIVLNTFKYASFSILYPPAFMANCGLIMGVCCFTATASYITQPSPRNDSKHKTPLEAEHINAEHNVNSSVYDITITTLQQAMGYFVFKALTYQILIQSVHLLALGISKYTGFSPSYLLSTSAESAMTIILNCNITLRETAINYLFPSLTNNIYFSQMIMGPILEEVLHRWLIQEMMLRRLPAAALNLISPKCAEIVEHPVAKGLRIFASSAVFAFAHTSSWDAHEGGTLPQFASGLVRGIKTEINNGNITSSIIDHIINNSCVNLTIDGIRTFA